MMREACATASNGLEIAQPHTLCGRDRPLTPTRDWRPQSISAPFSLVCVGMAASETSLGGASEEVLASQSARAASDRRRRSARFASNIHMRNGLLPGGVRYLGLAFPPAALPSLSWNALTYGASRGFVTRVRLDSLAMENGGFPTGRS